MTRLRTVLAALLLSGCGEEQEGLILAADPGWRAEVAATAADGFTAPDGLLWHEGGLWMADEAGNAVRRWMPGAPATTLAEGQGLSSPEDLVRDHDGNLYVTDDNAGGVRRIDASGRVTLLAGPDGGLGSTEGIALAPDGRMAVGDGDSNRVFAVAPDGKVAELIGAGAGIAKPESLAFDDAGNLYVADNEEDVLYLRTREGRVHAPVRGRRGFSPESIVWAHGGLYLTDSRHGVVWRYTPEGGLAPVALFAGELANVQGIAAAPDGSLYVSVRAGPGERRGYLLRLVPVRRGGGAG